MDARRASTGARQRRASRAALVSLAVVVMTLAGHSAASAALPGGPGVLVAIALGVGLTIAVTERRLTLGWLLAYLIGMQALLHVVLAVAGHDGSPTAPAHSSLLPSGPMAGAHLVAALAAAVVLVEADRIIERWATLIGHALGTTRLYVPRPRPRTTRPVAPMALGTMLVALRHAVARRGPPASPVPVH